MSAFIYKVIVRGKVFGEATTLAEAEAAAKKHGGKVLQEMGKTANPGGAAGERVGDIILRQLGGTNRLKAMINAHNFLIHPDGVEFTFSGPEPQKRGNNVLIRLEPEDTYSAGFIYIPKTSRHWATAIPSRPIHKYTGIYADQLMPLLERHTGLAFSLGSAFNSRKTSNPRASKLTPFAQAWFALMRTKPEGSYKIPLGDLREMQASYEDGDIDDRALWLMVPQPTVRAMLLPHQPPADLRRTGNPSNPPLEHSNAAALLDTVKPGKPQVIHGVKVSRVGAGYSIDRMVLSRELAIQRLEQGGKAGKVGNPKAKKRPITQADGVLPWAMPYWGKEQIEEFNEQADMAEAEGDIEGQREALRKMLAAAKKYNSTLDAQIAQSLLNDTYKTANPKAKPAMFAGVGKNADKLYGHFVVRATLADGDTFTEGLVATEAELRKWYPVGGAIQRPHRHPTTIKSVQFEQIAEPYPNPKKPAKTAAKVTYI